MASLPAAMAAASAYGSYPLTLIPGLMSAADQLTNYGMMPAAAPALVKSPQRTDRLEVSLSPFIVVLLTSMERVGVKMVMDMQCCAFC